MAQLLRKDRGRWPGSWWAVAEPDGTVVVGICCPACGTYRPLGPGATVLAGGAVTASWCCQAPGCGYEDWLILDGWGDT